MKQGLPWEANVFSDRQEHFCILWEPKIRYRVHKILPLDPNLSQVNPVHTLTPFFFKDHFSIILPSTPSSNKSFFPLDFPAKTLYISSTQVFHKPIPHNFFISLHNNI
jgi:hypothetical protein